MEVAWIAYVLNTQSFYLHENAHFLLILQGNICPILWCSWYSNINMHLKHSLIVCWICLILLEISKCFTLLDFIFNPLIVFISHSDIILCKICHPYMSISFINVVTLRMFLTGAFLLYLNQTTALLNKEWKYKLAELITVNVLWDVHTFNTEMCS
jgi:hypothetical protein